ncbi:MAG: hypothetical protein ACI4OI_05015, partial [Gemmiger sp.]
NLLFQHAWRAVLAAQGSTNMLEKGPLRSRNLQLAAFSPKATQNWWCFPLCPGYTGAVIQNERGTIE